MAAVIPPLISRSASCQELIHPDHSLDCTSTDSGRRKVLVLGDRRARGVSVGLLRWLPDRDYTVFGECLPDCSVSFFIERLTALASHFGSDDSVVVCIDLDSIGRFGSHHFKKLFFIGQYTNVIFSLISSRTHGKALPRFMSLYNNSKKAKYISIRIFDNYTVNGKFRISKRCLCENLAFYIKSSVCMGCVFALSCLRYVNTVEVTGWGASPSLRGDRAGLAGPDNLKNTGLVHSGLLLTAGPGCDGDDPLPIRTHLLLF